MSEKQPLPPAETEAVIDVSLKHVLIAFAGLASTTLTVGVTIVLLRDYAKFKRQKALIEAATALLKTIQNPERSFPWNTQKTPVDTTSTSPTTK